MAQNSFLGTAVLTYSNAIPVAVRGNTYTVDGTTSTFALPVIADSGTKESITVNRNGVIQTQFDFTFPSATLGIYGIDLLTTPAATEVVEIRIFQEFTSSTGPIGSSLVTLEEVKDYLSISSNTYDARMSNLIIYASGLIESYCGRTFTAANVAYEYHDGGLPFIFVNNPPVNMVWSVAEYDGNQYVPLTAPPSDGGLPNVYANANSTANFTFESYSGKVWKGLVVATSDSLSTMQGFIGYAKGVRIEYNGGYTTIPADLKLCCLDIVKTLHKGLEAQRTQFAQEQLQQMPYTAGFPPHIRRVLDLYRLVV